MKAIDLFRKRDPEAEAQMLFDTAECMLDDKSYAGRSTDAGICLMLGFSPAVEGLADFDDRVFILNARDDGNVEYAIGENGDVRVGPAPHFTSSIDCAARLVPHDATWVLSPERAEVYWHDLDRVRVENFQKYEDWHSPAFILTGAALLCRAMLIETFGVVGDARDGADGALAGANPAGNA